MFQNESSNDQKILVELVLLDGRRLKGKVTVPYGSVLVKQLNGTNKFLEFEDIDGTQKFVAKDAVAELVEARVRKTPKLEPSKAMESDNPYAVLGVPPDTSHNKVRAAYARLAKLYHPDQFNSVTLPPEVHGYMTAMFERISSAYTELKAREMAGAAE
ncbi:MAG: J domain-containing protein [Hyphomicrobiaceae bacterium]|nr:J domain-containing protein [Hyphomicrobiaceae bacterium]MCC0007264.1 J domain-containing protein [Hyphomicrobiaceae bacterium]